jgi:hypothetical protein
LFQVVDQCFEARVRQDPSTGAQQVELDQARVTFEDFPLLSLVSLTIRAGPFV